MAITYTWSVANMERNTADDGVITCHWYCLGADADENSARSMGQHHTPQTHRLMASLPLLT